MVLRWSRPSSPHPGAELQGSPAPTGEVWCAAGTQGSAGGVCAWGVCVANRGDLRPHLRFPPWPWACPAVGFLGQILGSSQSCPWAGLIQLVTWKGMHGLLEKLKDGGFRWGLFAQGARQPPWGQILATLTPLALVCWLWVQWASQEGTGPGTGFLPLRGAGWQ